MQEYTNHSDTTFALRNISFRVPGRTLLHPLSLTFPAGKVTGLIGHNGSGKSTLLKMLGRHQPPSEGEILLDAQPLESWSSKAFARKVAYLPQQLPPAEGMTVRELVAIGRYPWHGALGRFGAADREKVEEAISLVGLKPLALGIVPYGVADTINYRLWVSEPPLPDSVIDVGLRTEPNLELLTEMKPSFMVWSAGYGPSPEMLARIAPGRGFNFSDGKQPLAMARKSLTEMADLLNLQSAAETHLAQYEDFIRSMKPRFVKRGARPLLLTTLIDPRHMLVFGPNSLFQEILDEYGIPNAWQGETNFWGSTAVSIDRLAAYKDVDVLCFDHDNSKDMDALMATPLWQAMPFVRAGRFQRVPAVWFYGATLSAMHFVRVLDNAIGGKA